MKYLENFLNFTSTVPGVLMNSTPTIKQITDLSKDLRSGVEPLKKEDTTLDVDIKNFINKYIIPKIDFIRSEIFNSGSNDIDKDLVEKIEILIKQKFRLDIIQPHIKDWIKSVI